MLRIDRDVLPTMAKTPTLGRLKLDLLRQGPSRPRVHCAASGLRYRPLVPLWGPCRIRVHTIRAGFPCFGAALAGYVGATRDDDRERNRLCPPNAFPDSLASWSEMQARGAIATRTWRAEADIAALNPPRIEPAQRDQPAVRAASDRLAAVAQPGLAKLTELAGLPGPQTSGS